MPTAKPTKLSLAQDLFITLAARWDLKDKETAYELGKACFASAEGFFEAAAEAQALPAPKAPARLKAAA